MLAGQSCSVCSIPESMSGAWLGARKERVGVAGDHIDHRHQSRRAEADREHDSIELLPRGHCYLRPRAPKGQGDVSHVRPVRLRALVSRYELHLNDRSLDVLQQS